MPDTAPTYDDLVAGWRKRTIAHAQQITDATERILNGPSSGTLIADYITVRGERSKGPWVKWFERVGPESRTIWLKGRVVVPDSVVEAVEYADGGAWGAVEKLNEQWPVAPCPVSFAHWHADDVQAQDLADLKSRGTVHCGGCEHDVAARLADDGGIRIRPHNRAGFVIAAAE